MPSLDKQLCDIIDSQNVADLKQFLHLHPTLNLNEITPSCLSALWWALIPPNNMSPSFPIIKTLLETKQIDLKRKFRGQSLLGSTPISSIKALITSYSKSVVPAQDALDQQPPNNLMVTLASDNQSTHDSSINKQIDKAIIALYPIYKDQYLSKENEVSFTKFLKKLEGKFNKIKPQSIISVDRAEAKRDIEEALKRIKNEKTVRQYKINDEIIQLTLYQHLMLVWSGASDKSPIHFPKDSDLTLAGTKKRQQLIMEAIFQSQNEYTKNAACFVGTRNLIVNALDKVHKLVNIEVIHLTPEIIINLFAIRCKQFLMDLEEKKPSDLKAFIDFYFYDKKPSLELSKEFTSFYQSFTHELIAINEDTPPSFKLSKETLDLLIESILPAYDAEKPEETLLDPNSAFLHTAHIPSLKTYTRLLSLLNNSDFKALFDYENNLSELKNDLVVNINQASEHILSLVEKNSLAKLRDNQSLIDFFMKKEKYSDFLNTLSPTEKAQWCRQHASFIFKRWLYAEEDIAFSGEWLDYYIQEKTMEAIPKLLKTWTTSLPSVAKLDWLNQVMEHSYSTHQILDDKQFYDFSLSFALENGYTKDFPFKENINHQDLRGCRITSNILDKIAENCDLRLATFPEKKPSDSLLIKNNAAAEFLSFRNEEASLNVSKTHKLSVTEFTKILQSIPDQVNHLTLKGEIFHKYNASELKSIIQSIPPWISNISLDEFHSFSSQKWESFIQALPETLTSLSFNYCILPKNRKDCDKIWMNLKPSLFSLTLSRTFCKHSEKEEEEKYLPYLDAVPNTVSVLNIESYYLIAENYFLDFVRHFPPSLTELNFVNNEIGRLDDFKSKDRKSNELPINGILSLLPSSLKSLGLKQEFGRPIWKNVPLQIPSTVTSFSLGGEDCYNPNWLRNNLEHLPLAVTHLKLSHLYLGIPVDHDIEVLKSIPPTINSLDLSYNYIGSSTFPFVVLPPNLISLDLNHNNLWHLSSELFTKTLATFPQTLQLIDLSSNNLGKNSPAWLAEVFAGIPSNVKSLNLSNNDLFILSKEDQAKIIQAIPDTIETLIIDLDGDIKELKLIDLKQHIHSEVDEEFALSAAQKELFKLTLEFFNSLNWLVMTKSNQKRYQPAISSATNLSQKLMVIRYTLQKSPLTLDQLNALANDCLKEINEQTPVFATHRGWYRLHPRVRATVGILAALIILPLFILPPLCKKSYHSIFFAEAPKTTTSQKIDLVVEKLGDFTQRMKGN